MMRVDQAHSTPNRVVPTVTFEDALRLRCDELLADLLVDSMTPQMKTTALQILKATVDQSLAPNQERRQ